jgi:hypothetical protein
LDEEKFESNGLGDNKQNEDEVHILERTSNHIALEEAIECETRIKKKIDDIESIISNQVQTSGVHVFAISFTLPIWKRWIYT